MSIMKECEGKNSLQAKEQAIYKTDNRNIYGKLHCQSNDKGWLNVNGLNSPIKTYILEQIKKQTSPTKIHRVKVKRQKKIFYANGNLKMRRSNNIQHQTKQTLRQKLLKREKVVFVMIKRSIQHVTTVNVYTLYARAPSYLKQMLGLVQWSSG